MLKKWKYGLYIILFSLTLTVTSIVGVLAVFNADIFNNIGITYTPPKEVTLISGFDFNEILMSWDDGGGGFGDSTAPTSLIFDDEIPITFISDTSLSCEQVVFDYYTDENRAIVENADQCTSVAEDGSDDILMYQVGETVYILSDYNILANEDCSWMFSAMSSLNSIVFNNFNTKNTTNMMNMFESYNLTSLDLSSFNTSKVTNMISMFNGCSGLTTIYVGSSWSTTSVTSSGNMFSGCTSLVGGNGTTYNSSYKDATYARIDTADTPGYFTGLGIDKNAVMLADGQTFVQTLKDTSDYSVTNSNIISIAFDKNTEENMAKVAGVTGVSVALDGSDDILMYKVPNGSNYDVYVLSEYDILTNLNSSYMFFNLEGLTAVNFNNFNTSNTTNMRSMFVGCNKLTSLDLGSFNTSNVTNMSSMFQSCSGLTSLDLSPLNTSNATDMSYMFIGCSGLTSLDLGSFNTSKVTNMDSMFASCSSLTSLDLSSFNTSNATNISCMFFDCSNLATIYVSSSWSTTSVTNGSDMFYDCSKLVGGNGTAYNSSYTDKTYARIDTADTPGYFSKIVTLVSGGTFAETLKGASSISSNTNIISITFGKTTTENLSKVAGVTGVSVAEDGSDDILMYKVPNGSNYDVYVLSRYSIFANFYNTHMFRYLEGLTSINFNNFNTSNVKTMGYMFSGCSGLTSLDLSKFNTSKVTNMSYMFQDCSGLTSLDLRSFNTSKVTNMDFMFGGCSSLTSLDLSSFNTSNVTNMSYMFYNCSGLTSLDLSPLDTSNVTAMSAMFSRCSGLTSLDLSSFNTSNVTDMSYMFVSCTNLTTIYVSSSWSTASVTNGSDMFYNCTNLIGGNGTAFDSSCVDATYARIDTASTPGYFTDVKYKP